MPGSSFKTRLHRRKLRLHRGVRVAKMIVKAFADTEHPISSTHDPDTAMQYCLCVLQRI